VRLPSPKMVSQIVFSDFVGLYHRTPDSGERHYKSGIWKRRFDPALTYRCGGNLYCVREPRILLAQVPVYVRDHAGLVIDIHGYLAHKKLPSPRISTAGLYLGPYGVSRGGAVSYERGTPVLPHSSSSL